MDTVGTLLKEKGAQILSTEPHTTVRAAVKLITDRHVGSVLVMQGDKPLGIFTERDLMEKVVLKGLDPGAVPIGEVMTKDLVVVTPRTPIKEAMGVMTQRRCRHLPVLDGDGLVGLVSIGDCTRWVSRHQEVTIQHLTDYIASKYPA
jgi:CBS domain-containing protein